MQPEMTEIGSSSGTTRAVGRLWVLLYAVASLSLVVAASVGHGQVAVDAVAGAGVLAVVPLVFAARRLSRIGTNPWLCLAAAVALWTTGFVANGLAWTTGEHTPLVVEVMCLAAYAAFGGAFLLFAHARTEVASRTALIDAAVIGVAAALMFWVAFVEPRSTGPVDLAHHLITVLSPLRDGLLVAIVVWVLLAPGRHTDALWLLTAGAMVMLGTDVVVDSLLRVGDEPVVALLGARALALVLVGGAGLIARRELRTPGEPGNYRPEHVSRSLLMGVALLAVPVAASIGDLSTTEGTVVIGSAAALLAVGVIARFVNLVHQNRQAHEETARSERRFRMLADSAPVGIFELGRGNQVLYANAEARRLLGPDVAGRSVESMIEHVDETSHGTLRDALDALDDGRAGFADLQLVGGDPNRWITWQSVPVHGGDTRAPIAFASTMDISDLKQAEAALARQATHDPLTGLPNRRRLLESLIAALDSLGRGHRTGTVALMFIDLDGFKLVNDVLGHDRGDLLLTTASTRIRNAVRSHDIVARFGGDEFVVLLQHVSDRGELHDVAQRILDALAFPIIVGGEPAYVGASIGITTASGPDDDPDALIRNADAAMYRAKDRGRGRYEFFRPEPAGDRHRML